MGGAAIGFGEVKKCLVIFEILMHLEEYKWFKPELQKTECPADSPIPEEENDERNLILMFARGLLYYILENPFQL